MKSWVKLHDKAFVPMTSSRSSIIFLDRCPVHCGKEVVFIADVELRGCPGNVSDSEVVMLSLYGPSEIPIRCPKAVKWSLFPEVYLVIILMKHIIDHLPKCLPPRKCLDFHVHYLLIVSRGEITLAN